VERRGGWTWRSKRVKEVFDFAGHFVEEGRKDDEMYDPFEIVSIMKLLLLCCCETRAICALGHVLRTIFFVKGFNGKSERIRKK